MKTPREWAIEAFDGLKFLPSIEVVVAMLEEKFSTAQADARRADSMESIVSAADGGLIITWEKDGREASVAFSPDRAIMYYTARHNGSRVSTGCVETHAAVENLWRWVVGDPWCATGLVEGR